MSLPFPARPVNFATVLVCKGVKCTLILSFFTSWLNHKLVHDKSTRMIARKYFWRAEMKNITKQVVKTGAVLSLALAAATLYAQSCPVGGFNTGASTGAYPWPVWTGVIPQVPPSSTGKTYYVDGTNGVDSSAGSAATAAFKTIGKALSALATGDTILIRKGLYREPIDLSAKGVPTGTAAKPITIGSYGDGEVIVDGSTKITGWTRVSGNVWKAPVAFAPIGVVVNDVALKQVTQGQNGSTAPQVGLAGVISGNGKWYVGGGFITADFGSTIGAGDANLADVVVPKVSADQAHVFYYGQNYIKFIGLTIRGSGSNGVWGYGSNITIESCNIKFNGKAAVSFFGDSGIPAVDNAVLTSHIYQNVLINWPRGNNYNAEAGGSWPGTVAWSGNLRPLARGNIVHMNGGEGIATYGSFGQPSGSALFEQNVVYDNWSVNMYFDNQPNNVARNNFLFNNPPKSEEMLYTGAHPYDSLEKYTVCLMLADEQTSSNSTNNYSNLRCSQVYNNLIAGCRIGIRDYAEGATAQKYHGFKNTKIVNNTIILSTHRFKKASVYGIYLQDNKTPSGTQRNFNTVIQNNIVYGSQSDSLISAGTIGSLDGIILSHNLFFNADSNWIGQAKTWVRNGYAGFRQPHASNKDKQGLDSDPQLLGIQHFLRSRVLPFDYAQADLKSSSQARNAGIAQNFTPPVNFRLVPRKGWNIGAF
jgi:Right handed beta helix region